MRSDYIMYISLVPLVSLSHGQVPPDPMWDGIESIGPKICVVVMSDYTSYELVVSNPLNTISQIGKTSPNKR